MKAKIIVLMTTLLIIFSCGGITHESADENYGNTWNTFEYIEALKYLEINNEPYPFIDNGFTYDVDFMMSYLLVGDFDKAKEHFQKAVDLQLAIQSQSEHEAVMGDSEMRVFLASVLLEEHSYIQHFIDRYIRLYIENDISSLSQEFQYLYNISDVIASIAGGADFIIGVKSGKYPEEYSTNYNKYMKSFFLNYLQQVLLKFDIHKAGHRRQMLWFLLLQTKSGLYVFDDIWTVPQLKPSWLELFRYYKEIGVLESSSIEDIQNVSVRKELPEGFVKLFNEVFNN